MSDTIKRIDEAINTFKNQSLCDSSEVIDALLDIRSCVVAMNLSSSQDHDIISDATPFAKVKIGI